MKIKFNLQIFFVLLFITTACSHTTNKINPSKIEIKTTKKKDSSPSTKIETESDFREVKLEDL